jgi:hypothetical protein
MKIIFYQWGHIGDGFFTKSFIKQFCELNDNHDISLMLKYNSFLFTDIPNLKIIMPCNNNKYTNTDFNGKNYDPFNNIIVDNNEYLIHNNIVEEPFPDIFFRLFNDILYIKTWFGIINNYDITDKIDCDIIKINIYFNNIIKIINNQLNLNLNLINNINLLPTIPNTNIDKFLNFKLNHNNKIIFYYNYYGNACQKFNINHDDNIIKLSNKYPDYFICCALKPNVSNYNIISIEIFNYIKEPSCENISKAYYCAVNSDIVYSFDTGACFFHLNNNFNNTFKGIWYHVQSVDDNRYFIRINDRLKNDKVKSIINNYIYEL